MEKGKAKRGLFAKFERKKFPGQRIEAGRGVGFGANDEAQQPAIGPLDETDLALLKSPGGPARREFVRGNGRAHVFKLAEDFFHFPRRTAFLDAAQINLPSGRRTPQ